MLPTVTTLRDPLVKPLGKTAGEAFEKALGLRTAGDLLRHYPRRYYTRGELTPLDALREGDHVTVLAMVELVSRIGLSPDHRTLSAVSTSSVIDALASTGTPRAENSPRK